MQQVPKALAKGLGTPLVEHPAHLGAQKTQGLTSPRST